MSLFWIRLNRWRIHLQRGDLMQSRAGFQTVSKINIFAKPRYWQIRISAPGGRGILAIRFAALNLRNMFVLTRFLGQPTRPNSSSKSLGYREPARNFEVQIQSPESSTSRNKTILPASFIGLVLGCIEAKFCKKICVGKLSPRSTQCTPLHSSVI